MKYRFVFPFGLFFFSGLLVFFFCLLFFCNCFLHFHLFCLLFVCVRFWFFVTVRFFLPSLSFFSLSFSPFFVRQRWKCLASLLACQIITSWIVVDEIRILIFGRKPLVMDLAFQLKCQQTSSSLKMIKNVTKTGRAGKGSARETDRFHAIITTNKAK